MAGMRPKTHVSICGNIKRNRQRIRLFSVAGLAVGSYITIHYIFDLQIMNLISEFGDFIVFLKIFYKASIRSPARRDPGLSRVSSGRSPAAPWRYTPSTAASSAECPCANRAPISPASASASTRRGESPAPSHMRRSQPQSGHDHRYLCAYPLPVCPPGLTEAAP